jgi:hypothetical protein
MADAVLQLSEKASLVKTIQVSTFDIAAYPACLGQQVNNTLFHKHVLYKMASGTSQLCQPVLDPQR